MAFLRQINASKLLEGDPQKQIESIVAQLNEWARQLSNEDITKVQRNDAGLLSIVTGKLSYENGYGSLYYDSSETRRGIIGVDPDGEFNIHVSKEGSDVVSLFT